MDQTLSFGLRCLGMVFGRLAPICAFRSSSIFWPLARLAPAWSFVSLDCMDSHVIRYGMERMRQKLLVALLGVLVNTNTLPEPARLVTCGTQLAGDSLNVRSSA